MDAVAAERRLEKHPKKDAAAAGRLEQKHP
jgi:hypothetical protein